MIGRSGEVMVTRCGGGWRPGITAYLSNGGTLEAAGLEDGRAALFQSVDRVGERLTGRALTRRVVLAMIKRWAAAAALPPSTCCHHVPGDGDHGVPLERGGYAGARAADRRARVAEDDEALRPDGGHRDRRRDRAHRDLTSLGGAPALRRSGRRGVGVPGGPADGVQVWSIATRLGR